MLDAKAIDAIASEIVARMQRATPPIAPQRRQRPPEAPPKP